MKLRIEKGIPLPKPSNFQPVRDAMRQMQVGDSMKVSEQPNQSLLYDKLHPKKFTVRKEGRGFRIWRTK